MQRLLIMLARIIVVILAGHQVTALHRLVTLCSLLVDVRVIRRMFFIVKTE